MKRFNPRSIWHLIGAGLSTLIPWFVAQWPQLHDLLATTPLNPHIIAVISAIVLSYSAYVRDPKTGKVAQ